MQYLSRRIAFSAAHFYRNDEWTEEENCEVFGLCANPNGHGHDYVMEVMVSGHLDESSGIVMNINDVDQVVKAVVEEDLDGKFLNYEQPHFKSRISATENLVRFLWGRLEDKISHARLHRIRLYETPFIFAEQEGAGNVVQFSRMYHFSAAHRLHSEMLNDEENLQIFGKCNNPYGHGHNYNLQVTVAGEPDPATGMVMNLKDLDAIVEEEVINKFDHKHLNLDTEEFQHVNPTSENVVIVIWELLHTHIPNLYKVGLWETSKNYFEYDGEPYHKIADSRKGHGEVMYSKEAQRQPEPVKRWVQHA